MSLVHHGGGGAAACQPLQSRILKKEVNIADMISKILDTKISL
jgi:hypothetical protein